jgi:hypothetical protein
MLPAREDPARGDPGDERDRDGAEGDPDREQDDRALRLTGHGGPRLAIAESESGRGAPTQGSTNPAADKRARAAALERSVRNPRASAGLSDWRTTTAWYSIGG